MKNKVTKESLAVRIKSLELAKRLASLSLNEEYQLEAYKMLLERLKKEDFASDFMSRLVGPL